MIIHSNTTQQSEWGNYSHTTMIFTITMKWKKLQLIWNDDGRQRQNDVPLSFMEFIDKNRAVFGIQPHLQYINTVYKWKIRRATKKLFSNRWFKPCWMNSGGGPHCSKVLCTLLLAACPIHCCLALQNHVLASFSILCHVKKYFPSWACWW